MKTRIKQTTKTYDGEDITEYLAEVHCWRDSLTWYPATLKLQWMGYLENKNVESINTQLGVYGSLERAKKVIDTLLDLIESGKQENVRQKLVEKSRKTKYIRYP